jgi:hypothetical protein
VYVYYRAFLPILIPTLLRFWSHHKNWKLFCKRIASRFVVHHRNVNHTWICTHRLTELSRVFLIVVKVTISILQHILMFAQLQLCLRQHLFQSLHKWILAPFGSQLCAGFWKHHYHHLIQSSIIQIRIHHTSKILLLTESLQIRL